MNPEISLERDSVILRKASFFVCTYYIHTIQDSSVLLLLFRSDRLHRRHQIRNDNIFARILQVRVLWFTLLVEDNHSTLRETFAFQVSFNLLVLESCGHGFVFRPLRDKHPPQHARDAQFTIAQSFVKREFGIAVQRLRKKLGRKFQQSSIVDAGFLNDAKQTKPCERLGFVCRECQECKPLLAAQYSPGPTHDKANTSEFPRVSFQHGLARQFLQLLHHILRGSGNFNHLSR
jgi:hypothetical protein